MQGPLTFGGQLETLGRLQAPLGVGAHSQAVSQAQQQQGLALDDPLGSITGRIHRGHLEDQPPGLSGEALFGSQYSGAGPSSAALRQGFQQGLAQGLFGRQQQQQEGGLMPAIIPGVPVIPGLPASPTAGQGLGEPPMLPSSMLSRPSIAQQDPILLQLLAQDIMQHESQAASHFSGPGSSQQGSPQAPQWPPQGLSQAQQLYQQFVPQLQQQQQAGIAFNQDFNDGSSSTSSMNSVQVPQLQARPANAGLLRMPSYDISNSPVGGRAIRRGRSHSVGSMPRTAIQARLAQQAQRDPQGIAGSSFVPPHPLTAGSPRRRSGLMGPPRTARPSPSPSPSPDEGLLRSGHAPEHNPFAPPEGIPQGVLSNPAMHFGWGSQQPQPGLLPDLPNPFQSHANRPWGPSGDPGAQLEGAVVQSPPHESDTPRGEHAWHVLLGVTWHE